MKKILLLLIPLLIYAAPVKYGNSTHWVSVTLKAANIYEADTNVPIVLSGSGLEDVVAGTALASGYDLVVTNSAGTDLGREIASFNKTNDTLQFYYTDPATHPTNAGTELYLQWGGDSVANDLTIWQNCHGGTDDYVLAVHGEETSSNLVDATGNYSATDNNITYAQTGKILKAPEYNGSTSYNNWGDITHLNSVANFSLSFWLKQSDLSTKDVMFQKGINPSNSQIRIVSAADDLWFVVNNGDLRYARVDTYSDYMTANVFAHIAFVYDGTELDDDRYKIYIDGALIPTARAVGDNPTTTANQVGVDTYIGYPADALDGELDEVRIFTGALTENQNKTQYNIQDGYTTNATITIGAVTSFTTERKAYRIKPYQNNDYKTGAYRLNPYN